MAATAHDRKSVGAPGTRWPRAQRRSPQHRPPASGPTPRWRCATCGCSRTRCRPPTGRPPPSSPARPVKPAFDRRRQHPRPLRPGRAHPAGYDREHVARHARAMSPTPTPAPATGARSPTATKGGDATTDIYVDSLQPGLYGYCTTDQTAADQAGPLRRVGLLRRRQRLRRLPDQHARWRTSR